MGHNTNFNSQDLDPEAFRARVARFNRTADKITQEIAIEQLGPITPEEAEEATKLLKEDETTENAVIERIIIADQDIRIRNLGLSALTSSPKSVAKSKTVITVEQPSKKMTPADLDTYVGSKSKLYKTD